MRKLKIIILAAGKGTRMYSETAKVLHHLAGKPMIQHIVDACNQLSVNQIYLVLGHNYEQIEQKLANQHLNFVLQKEQLGTAHAVSQVIPFINDDDDVLILYGDGPLITAKTLSKLVEKKQKTGKSILLTAQVENPFGYGRIIRENNQIVRITEQKDLQENEQKINEINTGILLIDGKKLKNYLAKIDNKNAQNEYYLTDLIEISIKNKDEFLSENPENWYEIEGVNDRVQLAKLERIYQKNKANEFLQKGLSLADPNRFDLRGNLTFGKDVFIDINVIIEGNVSLGNNVKIGAGCILNNCNIADNCEISPYSIIEQSNLDENCTIGPFARLRPGNVFDKNVHIGNFVEVKKVKIAEGTKAGHLTYLGDSIIGKNVNIGAGTITCNYDGANKFQTIIGDDVFVGSDSQFIAPVKIENGVTIGAGSTITKDVFENELAISRAKQVSIKNWIRPKKENKK